MQRRLGSFTLYEAVDESTVATAPTGILFPSLQLQEIVERLRCAQIK
jgi:hypothetical protein